MYGISTALLALILPMTVMVSASPVARQASPVLGQGYWTNDYLGTVMTAYSDTIASGIPFGLSPLGAGGPTEAQLFQLELTPALGTAPPPPSVTYSMVSYGTVCMVSTVQTTSSEDWAPGYDMLQSLTVTWDESPAAQGVAFTLEPGYDEGSYYIYPVDANGNSQTDYRLNWYYYDSSDAPFIPIIVDSAAAENSQSWTWHPISS